MCPVARLDVRDVAWENSTIPLTTTSEGYLTGKAAVTNVGIFPYNLPGGGVRLELRLPEEVFKPESLETLKLKPMVNDHPKVKVTAANAKQFAIGSVGESIHTDPYRVYANVIITDQATIQEIKNGKIALSCGYDADLEYLPGVWMGQKYDAIQRNIRYNHLALVKRGRAGDDATLRLDTAIAIFDDTSNEVPSNKEKAPMLKKITIDGVDYEAEAKVIETLHATTTRLDSVEGELTQARAEMTRTEAELDSLQDQVAASAAATTARNDAAPENLEKAVQARVALILAGQKVGAEFKTDAAEVVIQSAVIMKAFPTATLEGKSHEYLSARFDSAMELLEKTSHEDVAREAQSAANRSQQGEFKNDSGAEPPVDSNKARARMIEDTLKASRQ